MVTGKFDVRPGKMGIGSAAYFPADTFLRLSHVDVYNAKEFSVVMWVYLPKFNAKGSHQLE